jgi:hypothetical protein
VPQSLRGASGGVTSQYAAVPEVSEVTVDTELVQQRGGLLTTTPVTLQGKLIAGLSLTGVIDLHGASTLSGSHAPITEGPRVGGHTFYVTVQRSVSGQYVGLVLTPPGEGLQYDLSATGSDTYTFLMAARAGICSRRAPLVAR